MDWVGGFTDQILSLDHEFKSYGMSSGVYNDSGFELEEDLVKKIKKKSVGSIGKKNRNSRRWHRGMWEDESMVEISDLQKKKENSENKNKLRRKERDMTNKKE